MATKIRGARRKNELERKKRAGARGVKSGNRHDQVNRTHAGNQNKRGWTLAQKKTLKLSDNRRTLSNLINGSRSLQQGRKGKLNNGSKKEERQADGTRLLSDRLGDTGVSRCITSLW